MEACHGQPPEALWRILYRDRSEVIEVLRRIHRASDSEEKRCWAGDVLRLLGELKDG